MSEHTENIRRAVKIGYNKLVDALDRMEKERDVAQSELHTATVVIAAMREERDKALEIAEQFETEIADLKKKDEVRAADTPYYNMSAATPSATEPEKQDAGTPRRPWRYTP